MGRARGLTVRGFDGLPPPGRYRCLERLDGRISEVVWIVESSDADETYEHQRERQRHLHRLEELSSEEVLEAMAEGESFSPPRREEFDEALADERNEGESVSDESRDVIERVIAELLQKGPFARDAGGYISSTSIPGPKSASDGGTFDQSMNEDRHRNFLDAQIIS